MNTPDAVLHAQLAARNAPAETKQLYEAVALLVGWFDSVQSTPPAPEPEPVAEQPRAADWMTTREAAEYARLSEVTLHRHLAAGILRSSQPVPRGHHRIRREWLEEWIENRRTLPKPVISGGRA